MSLPKAVAEPAPPPAWIAEITGGSDKQVAAEIKKLREEMQSLHGGLFSVSNRMEELISDSTSEKFQSHFNELAVLRNRSETDSAVASRIGQCEFAVLQATRELSHQVQSLEEGQKKFLEASTRSTTPMTPVTFSRSHSLTTSEGRSKTGGMKPPEDLGIGTKLSRSGSRESRNGQLGGQREGMLNGSLSTGNENGSNFTMPLPAVTEVRSREASR